MKTLRRAARSHTYGEYKIVTRSGEYGCEVYKRFSLADAQAVAETARESGMTAQVYVLRDGEWEEVDR